MLHNEAWPYGTANAKIIHGNKSAFMVMPTGDCFVWGENNCEQLGLGHDQFVHQPTLVKLPNGEKITSVIADGAVTFFISESNQYFVCGVDFDGLLGLDPHKKGYKLIPVTLPDNEKIQSLRVMKNNHHRRHVLIYSESGQWFGCGANIHGQLGLDHRTVEYGNMVRTPMRITLPYEEEIESINMQDSSTFIRSKSGKWFACGANHHCQLGISSAVTHTNRPAIITLPYSKEPIKWVTSDGSSTYILSESGKLYACGDNENGKLGLIDELLAGERNIFSPHPVAGNEQIESVIRDEQSSSKKSVWYACGNDAEGQSGVVLNDDNVNEVTQVLLPAAFSPTVTLTQKEQIDRLIEKAKLTYPGNAAFFISQLFLEYASYESFFFQKLPQHELAKKIGDSLLELDQKEHDYSACLQLIDNQLLPFARELTHNNREDAVDLLCLWKTVYAKDFRLQQKEITKENTAQAKNAFRFVDHSSKMRFSVEARVRQINILKQLEEMTQELKVYREGLVEEIWRDVNQHPDFYKPILNNAVIPKEAKEEMLSRLVKKLGDLRKNQEGLILPRGEQESSSVINDALLKYQKVTAILKALDDDQHSQQQVIENSIAAIKEALPDLEKSRDTLGMKILKCLLAICTVIAGFFVFDTKGGKLAAKHLAKLSLFKQQQEKQPMERKSDSLSCTQ